MSDLETAITATVERAVRGALEGALIGLRPETAAPSDDEVMGVPALAQYLGIGQRQAYQLVNCNPPAFPIKRIGTRILILRGVVRRWLEAGGDAKLPAMSLETRRLLVEKLR